MRLSEQEIEAVVAERDALKSKLLEVTADRNELWGWKSVLWAEQEDLQAQVQRLEFKLTEANAEVDRLREFCDAHGMPGLKEDEE